MPARVTMADVARAAGVHQTTVSLALREHPRIPAETRERVRKLAGEMGYRPNPLVSALIAERRRNQPSGYGSTLAFLTAYPTRMEWRDSHNYSLVFDALSQRAEELGYRLEHFWLRDPAVSPRRLAQILLARGIRGLIICPLPFGMKSIDFDFREFAAVTIGYTLESPALDRVSVDYVGILHLAVQRLRERGFERIGFVTAYTTDSRVKHLSLGAFLAEKRTGGSGLVEPLLLSDENQPQLKHWLRAEKPDALIASVLREYEWLNVVLPKKNRPFLCVVDARIRANEPGVVQNLKAEAAAVIDQLAYRIERARFGPPDQPQTTLVGGFWREPSA